MTVFVVNRVDLDLSGAEVYGDLRFINSRYVFGDDLDKDGNLPQEFLARMEESLAMFRPDLDFLLIAGDHLQLAIFSGMLAATYGHYRLLRFDRVAKGYWVAHTDCSNMRACLTR